MLRYFLIFLYIIFVLYSLYFVISFFVYFARHKQSFDYHRSTFKKQSLFFILLKLPIIIASDFASHDPNYFKPKGVIIFEGRQGSGKTSSLMYYADQLHKTYPLSQVLTNTPCSFSYSDINSWHDFVEKDNDIFGQIIILDEIQMWASSKNSKDCDFTLLREITTLRKQRKIILGTCQQFYMLHKDIRTQTSEVRRCYCIWGCFNIVFRFKPVVDYEGNVLKMLPRGFYYFLQTPELRNSYDTFQTIQRVSKDGFIERFNMLYGG